MVYGTNRLKSSSNIQNVIILITLIIAFVIYFIIYIILSILTIIFGTEKINYKCINFIERLIFINLHKYVCRTDQLALIM